MTITAPSNSLPVVAVGRWPRIAVTVIFVVHGLLFASWTAHIPHLKSALGLSDGALGFALLGAPVGSVCSMAAAAYLLPRWGSRRVVQIALVGLLRRGTTRWPVRQSARANRCAVLVGRVPRFARRGDEHPSHRGGTGQPANADVRTAWRLEHRVIRRRRHRSACGRSGISLTPQLLVLGTLTLLAAGVLTIRMLPDAADTNGHTDELDGEVQRAGC